MLAGVADASRHGIRQRVIGALARIPSGTRRHVVLVHDVLVAYSSFLIAMFLRQGDLKIWSPGFVAAHSLIPVFLLLFAVVARAYKMDSSVWRFASQADLLTIVKVSCIAIGLFYLALFTVQRLDGVPRSLPPIQILVLVFLLAGTRIAYATWLASARGGRSALHLAAWEPTLLVGAGQGAALLIELLQPRGRPTSRLEFVGIIDNRSHYRGRAIATVPVLGTMAELEQVIAQLAVHGMRPRRMVLTVSLEELGSEEFRALHGYRATPGPPGRGGGRRASLAG